MSDDASPADGPAGAAPFFGPDVRALLLMAIGRADAPVGVLQARAALADAGLDVSESTVARRLRDLDGAGSTLLLGKQGRVLTTAGSQQVAALTATRRREELIEEARTVHTSQAFLDLLRVRRALEPEAAREAAERADGQDRADLRTMQDEYSRLVAKGGDLPRHSALVFHRRLLAISRNPLLTATLEVALDPGLDRVEAALDIVLRRHHAHEVGARDHEELLAAIEAGDGDRAEAVMRDHLTAMLAEVERVTDEVGTGLLDRLLAWSST